MGVTGIVLVMGGVAPIPLRFVLARLLWARSVRRPGALARAPLFPAVPVGAGGWGGGAGRAPAPLSGGGRGDHPLCLGGVAAGAPAACGPVGGVGRGGRRTAASLPPLWGAARGSQPWPPLVVGALFPGVRVRAGSRGLPSVVIGGRHGGRGPHTVLVCRRVPPPGLVRALLWRAGVGWPVGRDPLGSRRLGALGRAVCSFSRIPPPPPASRSLLGEGGRPLGSGGAEGCSCGSQGGGGPRGGRMGGPLRRPPPPRPVGRQPAIRCLRRAPPGYNRAVGVARRPWASGSARSAANGSVRRMGEGGGGNFPALVRAPSFPRPASEGAAPFAPSWAPRVRRRSAAGRAGACGRFTGGTCRGRGAPSPRVQRPLRGGCGAAVSSVCLRSFLGLRGRGGGVGGGLRSPGAAS